MNVLHIPGLQSLISFNVIGRSSPKYQSAMSDGPTTSSRPASALDIRLDEQVSHTHTIVLLLFCNMSGTTRVSRYQKGKTRKVKANLDLLEQETVSGSGVCWAICKSAPHPRQPRQHPTTQFFYRPDALPAAQPTASKH